MQVFVILLTSESVSRDREGVKITFYAFKRRRECEGFLL